jgi:hypothetical protein
MEPLGWSKCPLVEIANSGGAIGSDQALDCVRHPAGPASHNSI